MTTTNAFAHRITDVPDFPKPGIVFKDITPLLADPVAFGAVIERFAEALAGQGVTRLAAIESRGFLFGAPLAQRMGVGLTLLRKPGKLPRATVSESYALEYGTDTLHVHADDLGEDDRVVIIDDVLATGGTAAAAARLIGQTGATLVAYAFLMELRFLNGRDQLPPAAGELIVLHPVG